MSVGQGWVEDMKNEKEEWRKTKGLLYQTYQGTPLYFKDRSLDRRDCLALAGLPN